MLGQKLVINLQLKRKLRIKQLITIKNIKLNTKPMTKIQSIQE